MFPQVNRNSDRIGKNATTARTRRSSRKRIFHWKGGFILLCLFFKFLNA